MASSRPLDPLAPLKDAIKQLAKDTAELLKSGESRDEHESSALAAEKLSMAYNQLLHAMSQTEDRMDQDPTLEPLKGAINQFPHLIAEFYKTAAERTASKPSDESVKNAYMVAGEELFAAHHRLAHALRLTKEIGNSQDINYDIITAVDSLDIPLFIADYKEMINNPNHIAGLRLPELPITAKGFKHQQALFGDVNDCAQFLKYLVERRAGVHNFRDASDSAYDAIAGFFHALVSERALVPTLADLKESPINYSLMRSQIDDVNTQRLCYLFNYGESLNQITIQRMLQPPCPDFNTVRALMTWIEEAGDLSLDLGLVIRKPEMKGFAIHVLPSMKRKVDDTLWMLVDTQDPDRIWWAPIVPRNWDGHFKHVWRVLEEEMVVQEQAETKEDEGEEDEGEEDEGEEDEGEEDEGEEDEGEEDEGEEDEEDEGEEEVNEDEINKDKVHKDEVDKDEINKDKVHKDEANEDEVEKDDLTAKSGAANDWMAARKARAERSSISPELVAALKAHAESLSQKSPISSAVAAARKARAERHSISPELVAALEAHAQTLFKNPT